MNKTMKDYIQEDIDELEKRRAVIPPDQDISMELIDYKEYYQLFLTTLKIAVNNGTLSEAEFYALKSKYMPGGDWND